MKDRYPTEEAERLAALGECQILETAPEELYDGLTALAAQIVGAPVALLGLMDSDRYWVKSRFRWNISFFSRETAFCLWSIASKEAVVVPDAQADPRFAANPLVTGEPRIRFYAGIPILSSEGHALGTLEVFDRVARHISDAQLAALRELARQASAHLNSRRRAHEAKERESEIGTLREALRESDERFRDLFDSADDMVMSIRSDGRLLHANTACGSLFGVDSAALSGRSLLDLIHPDAREQFRAAFDRVVGEGRSERVETVFAGYGGTRMVMDGILVPKVVDGYTVMTRVIFRDITERKAMEVELGKARDAALESARLKSQFLSNVSHEIRTPIHGVVGMLGLLLDSELTAEQREFALSAQSSADSLLALMNNILHVSRLESGKLSVSLADFDLLTTIERVVEVMQVAAQEKNLRLSLELDPELPTIVRGDPGRYRQVVVNLIGNAVKFTQQGSINVRVTNEKETETHQLIRVQVSDTGPGIEEEARHKLFQSFTQLDAASNRQYGGVGLGLSIAKQLVELMGGVIGVDSTPGAGSTFWFTVPFEKRVTERLAIAGSKLAFPGARVLVLDASETNRKLLTHFVSSWGMRTRTSDSPVEALERLRTEATLGDPYRVIVFDLHSSALSGIDLARAISRDPSIEQTGMIAMTQLGEQVDDTALREAGISAYLSKPVDKSELFDCMTAAMASELKHLPDVAERFTAPLQSSQKNAAPVSPDQRARLKILLAEDKPLNQKLTLTQLQSLGYTADAVSNGDEVISAVQKKAYDLILMDCQMPLMDGYEATIEIRKREGSGRQTRIIAMTANALEGDREKCLAAGMDDYLSKPTRREDLDAVLNRWFGQGA